MIPDAKEQTKLRKVTYLIDRWENGWEASTIETAEPARKLHMQFPGGLENIHFANRILAVDSNDQCIWLLKDRWDQGMIPRLLTDAVFPSFEGTGPTIREAANSHLGANPGGCQHSTCDLCSHPGLRK